MREAESCANDDDHISDRLKVVEIMTARENVSGLQEHLLSASHLNDAAPMLFFLDFPISFFDFCKFVKNKKLLDTFGLHLPYLSNISGNFFF